MAQMKKIFSALLSLLVCMTLLKNPVVSATELEPLMTETVPVETVCEETIAAETMPEETIPAEPVAAELPAQTEQEEGKAMNDNREKATA